MSFSHSVFSFIFILGRYGGIVFLDNTYFILFKVYLQQIPGTQASLQSMCNGISKYVL